jgi:integrase
MLLPLSGVRVRHVWMKSCAVHACAASFVPFTACAGTHILKEVKGRVTISPASSGAKARNGFEQMARRRFQDPTPQRRGAWWTLRFWQDNANGKRTQKRVRLAPATMPMREVEKIAAEMLRPMNQSFGSVGSATNFATYVETVYKPAVIPLLAATTRNSYTGMLSKYLIPAFGNACLRDMSPLVLQRYFSSMPANRTTVLKVRDALSSVLRSAMRFGLLVNNPLDNMQLPPDRCRRRPKPFVSPEQFTALVDTISEPYASMIYVAVWTGLRVSELIGLKWRCIHKDAITIDERFCRGDWSAPKTKASAATIGAQPNVLARIHRLKTLTVEVRAGLATRRYRIVKSAGPDDLVFQSVKDGKPMRDQNVLKRHIQPAAQKLGMPFVNWRCLRTSHATWLVQSGADPKSVQGQMRHSRVSTTMDIYAQCVPASQRLALHKLSEFCDQLCPKETETQPQVAENMVELVGIEPTTSSLRTMRSPS